MLNASGETLGSIYDRGEQAIRRFDVVGGVVFIALGAVAVGLHPLKHLAREWREA